jgi:WD40 repeat protein
LKGHEAEVYGVAFGPDGTWLTTGSGDHSIRLWSAANGKETARLKGHQGEVYAVTFPPLLERVVSASADHTVRLWRLAP